MAGETNVTQAPGRGLCEEMPRDTSLEPLLQIIHERHADNLLAVLVYGSWLRGQRDTLLDFYVLVEDYRTLDSAWEGWLCRALPPNVYHICHSASADTPELRAKCALLTLDRFNRAVNDDFHSYFWARFVQPCEILYARDHAVKTRLEETFRAAASTFINRVLPAMGRHFSSTELWTHGFSLTYRCEIRTESGGRGSAIYAHNREYYDGALRSYADVNANVAAGDSGGYHNHCARWARKLSAPAWWLRRVQGKLLSVLRLLKASLTFDEPLEYLLWKIERHSGLYIEPTQRQLRHPLLFAWPLLWRLYKQGAFR
ncbi:MAG: hypothetical protein PVJ71_04020 [Lysobacterales bacterium]